MKGSRKYNEGFSDIIMKAFRYSMVYNVGSTVYNGGHEELKRRSVL